MRTNSGLDQSCKRANYLRPEPGPNPKIQARTWPEHETLFEAQTMLEKKTKVKFGLKNLAMLSSYFDYIFVHLRQKARLGSKLSPKFLSTLGLNPARTRREKPGPTYNSGFDI